MLVSWWLAPDFNDENQKHLNECITVVLDVEKLDIPMQPQDKPSSEQVGQYMKNLASVRETLSGAASFELTVLQEFDQLKAHFSSSDNRPAYSLAHPIWDQMQKYFTQNMEAVVIGLKTALSNHAHEIRMQMDKFAEVWEPTAGGATNGKSWYASFKPKGDVTLTKHFEATLEKMTGLAAMEGGLLPFKQVTNLV
jgi:hypothetical protein